VLLYGDPLPTGSLNAQADALSVPLTITSIHLTPPATAGWPEIQGPGYPEHITTTTSHDQWGGLKFIYSADGGTITGSGPDIIWSAPENGGTFHVTVTIEDDDSLRACVVASSCAGILPVVRL